MTSSASTLSLKKIVGPLYSILSPWASVAIGLGGVSGRTTTWRATIAFAPLGVVNRARTR